MLTNGWRKYHWPEVWKDVKPTKEFPFAEGLTVSGKAFNTKEKPMPNATLNVMAKAGEKLGMFSAKTDLDGRFSIPDFNYNGETEVVFNALDYKDNAVDVKVNLDPQKIEVPSARFKSPILKQTDELEGYGTHSVARSRMEALYETNKVTKLDEVVVTEMKKEKAEDKRNPFLGWNPIIPCIQKTILLCRPFYKWSSYSLE
ncbi:carboxypeptidase-like regulatory domain-containing protein [Maribacter halichondriae]|uniref:carboxypeptidase-like regulatory domain-containing protein n=1 Tax=Maribacter halichondriae TaxID=2980554 RepID=UPI00235843EE|nr:carboxypeptidase-like regulatory domain-containing protein [Maribacter sp. Hal144]